MSSFKYVSLITTISVFTALFSIIFQAFLVSNDLQRLTNILTNLLNLEHFNASHVKKIKPKIAVGYGACSDVYAKAIDFFEYSEKYLENSDEDLMDDISNERELIQNFAYYFQRGAAAERFTPNDKLFKTLVRKAELNKDVRWSLGGNAPVMSTRFILEGADVLLGGRMSYKLKKSLPEEIRLIGDVVDEDDIHLILEYKSGDKWGPFTAPRANRYILHTDQNNPKISSLELFGQQLIDFNPRLLVISGLQMMDNFPFEENFRESRLEKVKEQISSQPDSTLIHFEMASYVEIKLLQSLLKNVIPFSDSIGMNEQELENIQQVLEKGEVSVVADSNPRVAVSLNQIRSIFRKLNEKHLKTKTGRKLTRIHVHTLAYQAILIVKNSQWRNTKNAAAKAALTAHRHVCGSKIVNPEQAHLVLDDSFSTSTADELLNVSSNIPKRIKLDPKNPVSCWNETISGLDVEICIAPVLVCTIAKQTAGAGDNISAAGLILQI